MVAPTWKPLMVVWIFQLWTREGLPQVVSTVGPPEKHATLPRRDRHGNL